MGVWGMEHPPVMEHVHHWVELRGLKGGSQVTTLRSFEPIMLSFINDGWSYVHCREVCESFMLSHSLKPIADGYVVGSSSSPRVACIWLESRCVRE